jgi:hypothetical protein
MSRTATAYASAHRAVPNQRNAAEHAGSARQNRLIGRSNQLIQAKLQIGPVDDPLEREADRAADAVLNGRFTSAAGQGSGRAAIEMRGLRRERRQEHSAQMRAVRSGGAGNHSAARNGGRAI